MNNNEEVVLSSGRGLLAFKISCLSAFFSILAVLLYEKPASFFENTGLIVSASLLVLSVLFSLIAIVFALLSIRTPSKRPALVSVIVGVAAPILSFLFIMWLAGTINI